MKTRNVAILVMAVCVVAILFTYFIVTAARTPTEPAQSENVVGKQEAAAIAPQAPAAPAIDKDKIIAVFDIDKESRRKKVLDELKKVMRDIPPYIGTGTKGYPVALQGKYEDAIQICEDEIKENPDSVRPRYTLAWIYARTGSYDQAVAVCTNALQRGPAFNEIRYILGWVYAKQGKFDDALKVCDEAISVNPYSAPLYYAKGRIQDLDGRNDDAIASYSKAVSLKNDFYEAYVFLGLLQVELDHFDEAIKAQKQAVKANMYAPAAYLALGLIYDETGKYDAALEQFSNALNFGSMGADVDSPKQPLIQTIGIDDAVIYTRMGILNDRIGSYNDALTAFNKAISIRKDLPEAYRGLVVTHLLLGDKESAKKNYDKLKAMDAQMANSLSGFMAE